MGFWKWLQRLFWKRRTSERRVIWPTAEEIALLPWFEGLESPDIVVISTPEGARRAYNELIKEEIVGFDTESKPTFLKGEKSKGPHVAQFVTLEKGYVFMLHEPACSKVTADLMTLKSLKKVGFGLGDDLRRIKEKLDVLPRSVLDLESSFAARGYGRNMGVKTAIAIT
jgi:hypothetical protein